MAHKKDLVVAIKSKGKILREKGERVYLPFNKRYSILLKNLNTKKVLTHIQIDGEEVVEGGLIINPNSYINLKRFVKYEEMNYGKSFKFIQKNSSNIEKLGDKLEDGILRIEYQFESDKPEVKKGVTEYYHKRYYDPYFVPYRSYPWWNPPYYSDYRIPVYGDKTTICRRSFSNSISDCSNNIKPQNLYRSTELFNEDEGKTIKGKTVNQNFIYGDIGSLEKNSYVITLKMCGYFENKLVEEELSTQQKIRCSCGKKSKSTYIYCPNCGDPIDWNKNSANL